ncbi:hypothetical protein B0T21DRAFT_388405 [Apiosordaria backusii]|uniref:Uncharacterized protein n=1 Tax=Apiosordaria backusii TaxID=314023 RepID=A0AA40EXS6_9PEZI|nr:hypothetical protein B0T21DRAFT_388405 [Apiosordaria backusii]
MELGESAASLNDTSDAEPISALRLIYLVSLSIQPLPRLSQWDWPNPWPQLETEEEDQADASDELDADQELWDNYFIPFPEYKHETAMMRAFSIRKGEYKMGPGVAQLYTHDEEVAAESSSAATSEPHPKDSSLPFDTNKNTGEGEEDEDAVGFVTLNEAKTCVNPTSLQDGYKKFALPFYDMERRADNNFELTFAKKIGISSEILEGYFVDDDARTASLIYLAGQVRTGDAKCQRCMRLEITRISGGNAATHVKSPIPFCTTAGRYMHGICAPCFAEGGTLEERLERCSLGRMNTWEEYQILNEGVGTEEEASQKVFIIGNGGEDEYMTALQDLFNEEL